jgi:HEAT repeat protein
MSQRTLAALVARRREAALAGHRGDRAAALVFVHDPDAVVRATGLRAVARCGSVPSELLLEAAHDDAALVRRATAELIGRAGDQRGLDEGLLELLDDDDVTVVEMAAWAAGERERGTDELVDRLCGLASGHEDAMVRESAVAALGAISDRRSLPTILRATTDKATVRRRAILALAP